MQKVNQPVAMRVGFPHHITAEFAAFFSFFNITAQIIEKRIIRLRIHPQNRNEKTESVIRPGHQRKGIFCIYPFFHERIHAKFLYNVIAAPRFPESHQRLPYGVRHLCKTITAFPHPHKGRGILGSERLAAFVGKGIDCFGSVQNHPRQIAFIIQVVKLRFKKLLVFDYLFVVLFRSVFLPKSEPRLKNTFENRLPCAAKYARHIAFEKLDAEFALRGFPLRF